MGRALQRISAFMALLTMIAIGPANSFAQSIVTENNRDPAGVWFGFMSCNGKRYSVTIKDMNKVGIDRFAASFHTKRVNEKNGVINWRTGSITDDGEVSFSLSSNGDTVALEVSKIDAWNGGKIVRFIGKFDAEYNIFRKTAETGCEWNKLIRTQKHAALIFNPYAMKPAVRSQLDNLQGEWDNGDQRLAGQKMRRLAPAAASYFDGILSSKTISAVQGDCRIARYLHQAMEQTETVEAIERWRDLYLLVCAKQGHIEGDFTATQWFFILLADAEARKSPAFGRALNLLYMEGESLIRGASRHADLSFLVRGGKILQAGGMVQSGLYLTAAASRMAGIKGGNDPNALFAFKIAEALGWWREGGAARTKTLLHDLKSLADHVRSKPKLFAAYHALRASVFESELKFSSAADEFAKSFSHLQRAESSGNSLDLVYVTIDLLNNLTERHLKRNSCDPCSVFDTPVENFVYWLRLTAPDSAYLHMMAGGAGFLDRSQRQKIDAAVFPKNTPNRMRKRRGSSLAAALQHRIGLGNPQQDIANTLELISARNSRQARRFSRRLLNPFIEHAGEFGDFGGLVSILSAFAKGLVDNDRDLAAEMAIERIVRLWFYGWTNKRFERDDDEHIAYATRLAPLFVKLAEIKSRRRSLKNYPDYLRVAHRMITEKLKREWMIASHEAVPALRELRPSINALARLLLTASPRNSSLRQRMRAEGFELLQIGMLSDTAAALQVAVRSREIERKGVSNLVLRRQNLLLDIQLFEAMAKQQKWFLKPIGAQQASAKARRQLASIETEISSSGLKLEGGLSDDANLTKLSSTANLLAPNELFLIVNTDRKKSTVVVVKPKGEIKVTISDLGYSGLNGQVQRLRTGLKLDNRGYADFPVGDANRLYAKLFGALTSDLEDAQRVVSAITGPLQALPLSVFVTKRTKQEFLTAEAARNSNISWFALKTAETRVPSIGAYDTLIGSGQRLSPRRLTLLGVGNPVLAPLGRGLRSINIGQTKRNTLFADIKLLKSLTSLPETADELRAIRDTTGSEIDRLLLGTEATETLIKSTDLRQYNVLAFATHGVVAGQVFDGNEPGLVLTPPSQATADDDGFLSMSEIAGLRLDADLVILSACDTATSDGRPLADGLSGLVRAFFVAGARNIVATHWEIPSLPSVAITTNMMRTHARSASEGPGAKSHWSLALQEAQQALIRNVGPDEFAHPASWGAFQVVGAN